MLLNGILCFLLLFVYIDHCKATVKNSEVEGYFWRDYVGFIPHDAFPGGNEKGNVTYIGQVLYNNLLVPAKIYPDEEKAYFEWGLQEHIATENIKILCTDTPQQLRWLSSSSSDFKNTKSKRFINGGYEPKSKLYIGRISREGETVLGKLLVNEAIVLHATQNGKAFDSKVFEVLYYQDPKVEAATDSKGYYWRDYAGEIPHDALLGGTEGGKKTYIALVLFGNLLVPGKVIESEKNAQFEWGLQAHTTSEDIKIFCTDKPEHFHWLSTDGFKFKKIKDKHFVLASHEGSDKLYIGRVNVGDDIFVGKLLVNEEVFLHTAQKGKSVQSRSFEVLYYDPPEDEDD